MYFVTETAKFEGNLLFLISLKRFWLLTKLVGMTTQKTFWIFISFLVSKQPLFVFPEPEVRSFT
jgi:hypothetical protein